MKPIFLILTCALGLGLSTACSISPLAGLAAACIFTFSVTVLTRPILLGYLIILGIALTSGMARGRVIPFLAPNEAILLYASVAAFPFVLMKRDESGGSARVFAAGILVLAAGSVILPCMAYPLRGVRLTSTEVIKLLAPLQYVLLFLLFRFLPADDQERFRLVCWMWGCASIVGAVGLLQAAGLGPVMRFLLALYPSGHTAAAADVQRVTSLMGAWNGLGTFLMINLLLIKAFQPYLKSGLNRLATSVATMFCTACLLASGSYAGLIGLFTGYLILSYFQPGGLREALLVLIAAALGFILLHASVLYRFGYQFEGGDILPSTMRFRLEVWRDVFWPVIQQYWLWGYRPVLQSLAWQWPESQYLSLLLRSGIFSLIAHFFWILTTLSWLYRQAAGKAGLAKSLAAVLFAMLITLSIMGLTNEVFTFSGSADYIWALLGLLAGSQGSSGCMRKIT